MSLLDGWLNDPQASAALIIGLVAGTWALAQFRPLARERRRETYDAMTTHYAELRSAREAAVQHFPPLMAYAQRRIGAEARGVLASQDAAAVGRQDVAKVLSDIEDWQKYGLAFTSAREILDSEAKFRSLLWCVAAIRAWSDDAPLVLGETSHHADTLRAATTLVHDLNAFLFHYDNGNYPARQTLGLVHRSLAIASKAMEPVVWAQSLDGRYGRRTLRIGVAAQHFNDVTEIHCTSEIVWQAAGGQRQMVHPRLKRLVLGSTVLVTDSPVRPRLLPTWRLRMRSWCWFVIGLISPTPKLWFLSYGGLRLYRHRRCENQLAGLLGVALGLRGTGGEYTALDFSWSIDRLRDAQFQAAREERRRRGRLAWLWLPRARGGPSGNE